VEGTVTVTTTYPPTEPVAPPGPSLEQVRGTVAAMEHHVATAGLPADVADLIARIGDRTRALLPRLDVLGEGSRGVHTVISAMTADIPAALALHRRLPPGYVDPDGRDAHTVLLEQLTDVADWLDQLDAQVCALDAARLAVHGDALRAKLTNPLSTQAGGVPDLSALAHLHTTTRGRTLPITRRTALIAVVVAVVPVVVAVAGVVASASSDHPPAPAPRVVAAASVDAGASPTTPANYRPPPEPAQNLPTSTCEKLPPSGGVFPSLDSCGHDIRPGAGSVEGEVAAERSAAQATAAAEVTQNGEPNLLRRLLEWAGGGFGWLLHLLGAR
jgi:hypothetical protein